MRVDLHIHSTNSDGTDTVEQIIDKAVRKRLDAIAITDHDNVNGVARAVEYAKGKIALISGIELSTFSEKYDNLEIHMLGYGVDYQSKLLLEKTHQFLHSREIRVHEIIAKLRALHMPISEDDLDMKCMGRLAIAKVLLKRKAVRSIQDAFDRYLGENGSCFVPSMRVSTRDGVRLIKEAGGSPVLAHPEKYLKAGILEEMLGILKDDGLVGLECFYPSHSAETTAELRALAKRFDLIETIGSDYHGKNKCVDIGEVDAEMSRENVEILMGHMI